MFSFLYLRLSEKASTPHLDRQYPPPVRDSLPKMLATFTTLPLAFFRRGRNCRVTSITPIRFTSNTFVKSSRCIHSGGPMGTDLPALFTSPQRPAGENRGQSANSTKNPENKALLQKMALKFSSISYSLTLFQLLATFLPVLRCI